MSNDTDTLTVKLGLKLSQLIGVVSLHKVITSNTNKTPKRITWNTFLYMLYLRLLSGFEESSDDNKRLGRTGNVTLTQRVKYNR